MYIINIIIILLQKFLSINRAEIDTSIITWAQHLKLELPFHFFA